MATVTIHSDFRAQENKIYHFFNILLLEVMGPDVMILIFWMLVSKQFFHPPFSPSSRGSLLPLHFAIRVVLSAYLRLLIFLPAILSLSCDSSSPAFCMMNTLHISYINRVTIYSLVVLNSQFWTSPLFLVQCYCFLTCIQVYEETGEVVWYSYVFKNFPQFGVIHTVKGFSIVNVAEVYIFLEFPCFFYDPTSAGNLISGSSAFSKPSLYIWKFSVHVLLKASLNDFEQNFASMWNECNCMVVWTFFGISL